MWNSKELGKTKCRSCYNGVPRYELIQDGRCLKCREWDNKNYKLTDWEKSTTESRRLESLKELKSKEKKTENDYLNILSCEYDMPELGSYTSYTPTKWVECIDCKKSLGDYEAIHSKETDWKYYCSKCWENIEAKLESKIEIPPKK